MSDAHPEKVTPGFLYHGQETFGAVPGFDQLLDVCIDQLDMFLGEGAQTFDGLHTLMETIDAETGRLWPQDPDETKAERATMALGIAFDVHFELMNVSGSGVDHA